MTDVFVVEYSDESGSSVEGVYATRELAQLACEAQATDAVKQLADDEEPESRTGINKSGYVTVSVFVGDDDEPREEWTIYPMPLVEAPPRDLANSDDDADEIEF